MKRILAIWLLSSCIVWCAGDVHALTYEPVAPFGRNWETVARDLIYGGTHGIKAYIDLANRLQVYWPRFGNPYIDGIRPGYDKMIDDLYGRAPPVAAEWGNRHPECIPAEESAATATLIRQQAPYIKPEKMVKIVKLSQVLCVIWSEDDEALAHLK